jgi:glutathione S-transferase
MWTVWAMTELEGPVITAFVQRVMMPEGQRDEAAAEAAAERFRAPLGVLEGALAGKEYLVEDRFTVADLNVASVLMVAPLARFDLSGAPSAQAWLTRSTQRPALARVLAMK